MSVEKSLYLPPPGELAVHREFVDPSSLQKLNGEIPATTNVIGAGSLDELATQAKARYKPDAASGLLALTTEVIGSLDYHDWQWLTMGPNRMYPGSVMSPHQDRWPDVRVLVEGGRSTWNVRPDSRGYPDRIREIELLPGDTLVLNNLCDAPERLIHGVKVDNGVRTSYRFSFSPEAPKVSTPRRATPMDGALERSTPRTEQGGRVRDVPVEESSGRIVRYFVAND